MTERRDVELELSGDEMDESERRALALWRAPEPPPDFVVRVMARLEAQRGHDDGHDEGGAGAKGGARPLAMAALAAAVVAAFFVVRLLTAGAISAPATIDGARVYYGDGGTTRETSAISDGVRI